jgi:hypothetical protein
MKPRIYVYLITFVDQPYWYWGWHKEKKFGDNYMGSPKTNKKYWDLYEPVKEIIEVFDFTAEGEVMAQGLEKSLIKPDLNNPLCLNESCGGLVSTRTLSESAKKLWKDSDYRDKISKAMSKRMLETWKDSDYRDKVRLAFSESKTENWKDPDYREKISRIRKEMWEDVSHQERMSNIMKEVCSDPTYRKGLSDRSKKMWEDPEFKQKMGELREQPDFKEKHSQGVKRSHQSAKYRVNLRLRLKGKRWIFCPVNTVNKLISLEDPIPEGFSPGRLNDDYEELEKADIKELFEKVKEAGINLQKYGWVREVSSLWKVSTTQVRRVFDRYWDGPEPYKRK